MAQSEIQILLVNGPNLNLLGTREPGTYGSITLEQIVARVERLAERLENVAIIPFQSNHEGEIIDFLHDEGPKSNGIVINPGAFTHYSYAIRDALSGINRPTVEVHISNIHQREEFRHHSVIAPVCRGQIAGLGPDGYEYAVRFLLENAR